MAYSTLSSLLTGIADSIRSKKGTTAKINAQNLPSEIDSITLATGNAGTGDVLSGKTFSNSSGNGLTGTMTNRGAVSTSINAGSSYTIPAGYHNGSGKVTANANSGNAGTSQVLSGYTFYSNSATKQTGTMTNNGAVSTSVGVGGSYTVPAGYHNGSGKVSGPTLSGNAATNQVMSGATFYSNSGTKQTGTLTNYGVEPTAGRIGEYQSHLYIYVPDISSGENNRGVVQRSLHTPLSNLGNASTAQVLSGTTFTSSAGLTKTGAMTNRGAVSATISPGGSYTIPAGYHCGSLVEVLVGPKKTSSRCFLLYNIIKEIDRLWMVRVSF